MSAVTAIATSSAHAADAGTDIHDTRSRYINEPWHKGVLFLDGRLAVRRGLQVRPEREWDDDAVVAVSVVGWLLTLLVAMALVVGLVLFFATSGFWGGGGDPPF